MKISRKKFNKLYNAIYKPIMDLRVKNKMGDIEDLDEELYMLENRIYQEVKQALELQKA